jgi:hypothetical protein
VETDSGSGGKIFRARWKPIQGRVEEFSWKGGMFFMVKGKEIQGIKMKRGKIFRVPKTSRNY